MKLWKQFLIFCGIHLSLKFDEEDLTKKSGVSELSLFCFCSVLLMAPWCSLWRCGVVISTTAQLYSTKPELRFCAGSNPACGMSEICDGEDLWQWSQLEIRLNTFHRSAIPQKQFIIFIIKEFQCVKFFS